MVSVFGWSRCFFSSQVKTVFVKICMKTHRILRNFYAYQSNVAVFRIRIGSGFNQVSGFGSEFATRILIRIRNPDPDRGGQKWPTKIEKSWGISCFEGAGCSFFRVEGLSCSLDGLYMEA
jgi:hypothetical protein